MSTFEASPYMSTSRLSSKKHDRLSGDGPCSSLYEDLKQCSSQNQVARYYDELKACPNQMERLTSCIHKHPLHHYSTRRSTTK